MKKRMLIFMVTYFFRLIQFKFSHFLFYSKIIFNSSLINCGNFSDVNNEPLDLSLKKQNSPKNSMHFSNDNSDSEFLEKHESEIQSTNSQFNDPNFVNYRSMNSKQDAQISRKIAFSKFTYKICPSVKKETDLNIDATENITNSSNFNPNNPKMLDNKEKIINQDMNTNTYQNNEKIVQKYLTTCITTNTESFNIASSSKKCKQKLIQEENIDKVQKLASSSISIKKKEKFFESKKWKLICINKYLENTKNNTINGDKYASDIQNSQSEIIQNTLKNNLRTKEKNISENVSLINKKKSRNKNLSNNESNLNIFDRLNKICSIDENNLQKYFHCHEYNYKFYKIKYNESEIVDNNENAHFDFNIDCKEDLYKVTKNLIELIKEDCDFKKNLNILDKSLVEQQKIQSDFKNINLKTIKRTINLINGLRQFKNAKNAQIIHSYNKFIRFYICFVEPISYFDSNINSNLEYLKNFSQKFADSYIFLKDFNFLNESKNSDLIYAKNVHKSSSDDLSNFENKINEFFENKNYIKNDLIKELQKILEDEKLNSQKYVTKLREQLSLIKFVNYQLLQVKSNIIVLCFILINNILNYNDHLKYKIQEMIINYIYIYFIVSNIQYFKHVIIPKASLNILSKFEDFNNYLLKDIKNGNTNLTIIFFQGIKKMIIQNKKQMTIFNYFFDFYSKLLTVTNDKSFLKLKTKIENEIKTFIFNYSKN